MNTHPPRADLLKAFYLFQKPWLVYHKMIN
jgi:hypothetical protein